ncbi:MAG TPA: TraR/DksA C4-type zinc finger protein [Terriglobia bacterium]
MPTTIVKPRKASYKTILLKKRQELLASIRSEPDALSIMQTPDEVEFAVKTAAQDVSAVTADLRSQTLREVEGALVRVSRGSYGICETCGDEIALARLKAIPWARRCVTCEELMSRN